MLEHSIQNTIMQYLAMHDFLRVFRQNTGAVKRGRHMTRFGIPGQADIRCVVAPLGRLMEVEVKSETGRQAPAQKNYQAMLESLGAVYILARCVEDVWRACREHFPDHDWRTPGEVM